MIQYKRIGQICSVLNGFAFKSENYVDSGLRIIRIANVQKGAIEDSQPVYYPLSTPNMDKYLLHEGDLLLSLTGNVGRVAILGREFLPAALNQRVACLRITDTSVTIKYLFHILNSTKFEEDCIQAANGVAQKNMSTEWLKQYEIPIYPVEMQERIVKELDKIQAVIQKRYKQISSFESLVKSQFIEMFGEIGSDKNGWGIRPLAECCDVNPKKAEDARIRKGMEISFVPMQSVSEQGDIDTTAVRTYEEVQKGFTYFSEGDVLFAKITPCMENGKGAIARGLKNSVGFGSTEFHVLRPKAEVCNSEWIYAITSFSKFRQDAARKMTGSAGQRRVPASFLASYMVSCPPIELQEQFAHFVEQTDKSKVLFTQKLFFQLYMAICVKAFEKNAQILYNCRREVAR